MGRRHIATLTDGRIEPERQPVSLLQSLVGSSLQDMRGEIHPPVRISDEVSRQAHAYENAVVWNTFAGIVNSVSISGHGGSIIIVPSAVQPAPESLLRIKYALTSSRLRSAVVNHINARHALVDTGIRSPRFEGSFQFQGFLKPKKLTRHPFEMTQAELANAIKWIARLAGCDGAILLSDNLCLLGFGVEVRSQQRDGATVIDDPDDASIDNSMPIQRLEVEKFGMRHRSAFKLVSHDSNYKVLVVSQDGPVSGVWSQGDGMVVHVRRNIDLMY